MFKYSTSTLINGLKYFNDQPAWFVNKKGAAEMTQNGETVMEHEDADKAVEDSFVLTQKEKFVKDSVIAVSRAKFVESQKEILTIDLDKADLTYEKGDIIRLFLYIRTANAADPMYANDFVYKGRPLFIEAKAGKDASEAAENLKKAAKRWINLLFGDDRFIVKVKAEGTVVTIEATSCEQRFHAAEIQEFDPKAVIWAHDGAFVTMASMDKESDAFVEDMFEITQAGRCGFGTYSQILKDLRLPTNANTRFYRDLVDEVPLVNGKYWQYVVTLCTERPEMQGTSVLGQYNKSITSHIMFVEDAVKEAFEADLLSVLTDTTLTEEEHDAEGIEIFSWKAE